MIYIHNKLKTYTITTVCVLLVGGVNNPFVLGLGGRPDRLA